MSKVLQSCSPCKTDYVIIVAGGKGLRMGSDIPKQFLPIGGKPVLMRTLERFREYSPTLQIILVLPKTQQAYWQQLLTPILFCCQQRCLQQILPRCDPYKPP